MARRSELVDFYRHEPGTRIEGLRSIVNKRVLALNDDMFAQFYLDLMHEYDFFPRRSCDVLKVPIERPHDLRRYIGRDLSAKSFRDLYEANEITADFKLARDYFARVSELEIPQDLESSQMRELKYKINEVSSLKGKEGFTEELFKFWKKLDKGMTQEEVGLVKELFESVNRTFIDARRDGMKSFDRTDFKKQYGKTFLNSDSKYPCKIYLLV